MEPLDRTAGIGFRGLTDEEIITLLLKHQTLTATAEARCVSVKALSKLIGRRSLGQQIFNRFMDQGIRPPIDLTKYIPVGHKLCPKCMRVLPIAHFSAQADKPNGLASWCRKCSYVRTSTHPSRDNTKAYHKIRREVYAFYGDACFNCNESIEELLTIEHKNGHPDPKNRKRGYAALKEIKDNGFPDNIGLLCWNCNCFKGRTGQLPDCSLYWTKIDPNGPGIYAPQRPGDAGFDLAAAETIVIKPGHQVDVPTNVQVSLPRTLWGEVRPRSSIARKGIQVEAGLIDSCYTGPLFVLMRNLNRSPSLEFTDWLGNVTLERGERVAQLVTHRRYNLVAVEVDDWNHDPRRGEAAFGSTGA